MRRGVLAGLLVSLALGGCDVAIGITIGVMSGKKKSDSSAAAVPDTSYHVWIADTLTGTEVAEQLAIAGAGGIPTASWTHIGTGLATQEFNPSLAAASVHYILIQCGDLLAYHLDAIEVMDASGTVIEWASGGVYFDQTTTETEVWGTPNGKTADLTGISGHKAFLFTKYSGPIEKFRVNIWSTAPESGDVVLTTTYDAGSVDQRCGGAGLSPTGDLFIAYEEGVSPTRSVSVLQVDSAGVAQAPLPLENNITNSSGSETIAIGPGNDVYVAWSSAIKEIKVRRYNSDLSTTHWTHPFVSTGSGAARVEAHGLAVNGIGDAYIAGGLDFGGLTGFGHFLQRLTQAAHVPWAAGPLPPVDTTHLTYWRGVAVRDLTTPSVDTEILTTGDLTNGLLPASQDAFTRRSLESTTGASDWDQSTEGGDNAADLGNVVRVDTAGNVYVGGFLTRTVGGTPHGKDAAILKFTNAGTPVGGAFPLLYNGVANGDDEVLDLAIDVNGDLYAVGYETVAGQGRNLWVRRYASDGSILWTRTHAGSSASGDDRAVSVQLSATHVFVVGEVTNTGTNKDLHVRKYVK